MAILEWEEEERVVLVAISQQLASDLPDQPYLINRFFFNVQFQIKKISNCRLYKKKHQEHKALYKSPIQLSSSFPFSPFLVPSPVSFYPSHKFPYPNIRHIEGRVFWSLSNNKYPMMPIITSNPKPDPNKVLKKKGYYGKGGMGKEELGVLGLVRVNVTPLPALGRVGAHRNV